jgi:hypothetical protein
MFHTASDDLFLVISYLIVSVFFLIMFFLYYGSVRYRTKFNCVLGYQNEDAEPLAMFIYSTFFFVGVFAGRRFITLIKDGVSDVEAYF